MTHIQLYKACSENVAITDRLHTSLPGLCVNFCPGTNAWRITCQSDFRRWAVNRWSFKFLQGCLPDYEELMEDRWRILWICFDFYVVVFLSEKTAPCFFFGPRNIAMIPELTEVRYLTVRIDAFMEVTEIHGRMKRYSEMFKILIKLLETDWNIVLKAWSLSNLYIHLFQKILKV